MSKYTTEVRFICESKSGLEVSSGADKVDEVIAGAWDKIFTTKAVFFDEAYRSVLCQKILKHYYLREICCETVGIWKLWMNERLETIMPYYNQLYESAKITFEPLEDVNVTRKHDRNVKGTEDRESNSKDDETITSTETDNKTMEVVASSDGNTSQSESGENSASSSETKIDLYSDTPQGAITGLENENYLTNARKITDSTTSSGNDSRKSNGTTENDYTGNETDNGKKDGSVVSAKTGSSSLSGNSSTTEDYLETLVGKHGSGTYSKMLMEFRETFLNIDTMVIEEFKDLFFGLW